MDKKVNSPIATNDVAINTTQQVNSGAISIHNIETFEQAEKFADYIANSTIWNKAFLKPQETEDGIIQVPDKSAIITCLMLGAELGFKPMESITFGRLLDRDAVIKCKKGASLGIDPISAMQNIYVFKSRSGTENIYTGIHVVEKVLIDARVQRDIIEYANKPHIIYIAQWRDSKGEEVEFNEKIHFIMNGLSGSSLEEYLKKGLKPVTKIVSKRALVRLTRHYSGYKEVIEVPYTLQQAIDAGLYKGRNSFGVEIEGKDNWNNHPETHLIKMSTILGARIIAADRLHGIYIPEELNIKGQYNNSFKPKETQETTYEEIIEEAVAEASDVVDFSKVEKQVTQE